ncbi:hypothetical protein [Kitasatospora sp. NPDC085879]|uniref:hypothetical protein n=1 Tax=Kitasatospora sp. NPDC085879 TaxID=3154769 RepID=UPI003429F52F
MEADELGQVAAELREATAGMGGAMHALDGTSPRVTGHQWLDGACEHFAEDWKYGLKQLDETRRAIGEGLGTTVRSYRATDEAIRTTMAGRASKPSQKEGRWRPRHIRRTPPLRQRVRPVRAFQRRHGTRGGAGRAG